MGEQLRCSMLGIVKILSRFTDYQYFIFLFVFSLIIYVLGVLKVQSFFWGDSLYYYAYTRSIVLDHDIDFSNQAYHPILGFPNEPEVSPKTGQVINKFSPGTSLFWIPGLVVGQLVSGVGNVMGYNTLFVDGAGVVPQFFIAVSALLFGVLGLWFVYKTLLDWFSKKIAVLSVVALFFTTQLFYYVTMDPVNSHSISFLISAGLLWQFSMILKTNITWKKVIPMGITAGLLILVRNQDIVVVLPILIALLLVKKESMLEKLNWLTLFGGSAFLIMSLQIYTTLILFGILGSPYVIGGEQFYWFRPDFLRVLFTLENGLFFFAPILVLAVFGLFKMLQNQMVKKPKEQILKNPKFVLPFVGILTFFLQLYVVASWGREITGGPYGSRMFVSVLPALSIGLATCIVFLQKKLENKQFWLSYAVVILLFFLNMLAQTFWMLYRF